ncbi:hypothetical protein ANOM_009941 [Aspergillus nomiae NRRL 13137]|uniref:Major facilitator superfamily (MFS) profile domain-containing protein n=1 Tax=Aspergillus nomiae NRRL (strain ATCC 15546 / NRRL 13137 / CBS 260.88 / M93) TaxID=1509407 RepID=A0A0L1ITR1_ASPN3|nr:uncharacterized protein ANOM_009941 [Aspergillus nomiae NRRL 13137]KNG82568.1 hypothetical protein ANOM_009941 [Aspergillus nomiae NRRL 13137]
MSGNITFVPYHDMIDRSRRIRLRRACSECRRKKRRCNHQLRTSGGSSSPSRNLVLTESQAGPQANISGAESRIEWTSARELSESLSSEPIQGQNQRQGGRPEQDQSSSRRPEEAEQRQQQTPGSLRLNAHPSPHTTRFVSDLNPEARLLDETTTPEDAQEMAPGEPAIRISLHGTLSRATLEKITLIRILGLLSLHQEGSEGMDESSSCIAQAMHSAQSLALHLPRPNDDKNELKRIFWCLWTLDRLNAATNSRPCVMADIDIAVPDLTPQESGSIAFDVCFRIAKILNKVIALYRPTTKDPASGWDTDFPGFEQVMDEMHAWQLSSSTIATLHIFYHATAILSHRLKTITTLPSPTPARLRQQLSAIQVIRYMQYPDRLDALHPFPVVVYAASLALSVSYQQLRYSRLSSEQEDARHDFNTGCDILQELRLKWASADAMASLAHRISAALEQLPSLDILRINRFNTTQKDNNLTDRQGITGDEAGGVNSQPSVDVLLAGRPGDFQATQSHLETMDLFAGMDDVSWMYLDAENPISFDAFPVMNLEGPYTSCSRYFSSVLQKSFSQSFVSVMFDKVRKILKDHGLALLYCGVSSIGALVYGYDNTYYNGVLAMQQFKNDYGTERDVNGNLALSSSFQSVTASSIYIGDLLGAMLAAPINDRWGRKSTFWLASFCILCGGIAQVADTHFEAVIIVGRILMGLGVGQFTVTSLLYIGEVAPTDIRGPALMSYQFLQSCSQLVASGLSQGTESMDSSLAYKLPMGGLIVLPLLMFAALPIIPESPLWYAAKGRLPEAESVLRRLHRNDPTYDPTIDLATLESLQRVNEQNDKESTWGALLFDPIERTKVIWSAGAMYAQQACGILFFYVYGVVFVQAIGIDEPFLVQLIQNILQICAVTVSMVTANGVPRRLNLLVTTSIMLVAFVIIGGIGTQDPLSTASQWVIVIFSFVIVCVINYGLSTVAYTVAREMAVGPNQNKIMSVSIVTFYFTAWVISFTAPYLYYNAGLGPMVGFVYAGTTLTSLIWVWFCVAETTGRSNWEIARLFDLRVPARKWAAFPIDSMGDIDSDDPKKNPIVASHFESVP